MPTTSSCLRRAWLAWAVSALIAAVAAACGGGGEPGVGSSGTGVGQAGVQFGSVSGFGSVIVEGNRYDDTQASISIDVDPAAPRAGTSADVALGMQAEVAFDSTEHAQTIRIGAVATGAIEAKTADGFVLAGQTIRVVSGAVLATVFDGFADPAELAIGDRVEVHGQHDAAEVIVASRIARLDPAGAIFTRVAGTATPVDATGQHIRIGALTIDLDSATSVLPAASTLAAGQHLTVWANTVPSAGHLTARTIRIDRRVLDSLLPARVGGLLRNLDRAGGRFRVAGVDVDFTTATFVNGMKADLAEGQVVRVRGSGAGGILRATEVALIRDASQAKVEITGLVSDFLSQASFRIRGTLIDASGTTAQFVNGGALNLTDGVLLKVEGGVSNGVLRPTRVEFLTGADSRTQDFLGLVSDYQPGTGSFSLLGAAMQLSAAATFEISGGATAQRADFSNGMLVRVHGAFQAGIFVVDDVTFRQANQPVTVKAEGLAYDIDLNGLTLRVNGYQVRWTASTRIDGNLGDLRPGKGVKVEGTIQSGQLVATRLMIGLLTQ